MKRERVTDAVLATLVINVHKQSGGAYGAPRILRELRKLDVHTSKKRIARIMRDRHLSGARLHKRPAPELPIAPNLLERAFTPKRLNSVWAGDVTQLETADGWLYVAVLIDLHSRYVVGYSLGERVDCAFALAALRMATHERQPRRGLIHHTDRGAVYTARDYQRALKTRGILPSMSARGRCLDNAAVESWFALMKRELRADLKREGQRDVRHAPRLLVRRRIVRFIRGVYNSTRLHSGLEYMTPEAFERLPQAERERVLRRVEAARRARMDRAVKRKRERMKREHAERVRASKASARVTRGRFL
jgi:transposase InsO family protein